MSQHKSRNIPPNTWAGLDCCCWQSGLRWAERKAPVSADSSLYLNTSVDRHHWPENSKFIHIRRTQLLLPPILNVAFRFFVPRIAELFPNEKLLRKKKIAATEQTICSAIHSSKNLNATFNLSGKSNWVRLLALFMWVSHWDRYWRAHWLAHWVSH